MRWSNQDHVSRSARAEARLRERELQLAQFIDDAPVAIAMFDKDMRYVAVSRAIRKISARRRPPN